MAQLKSTVVAGDLSVTGAISSNSVSAITSFSDVQKPAIAVSYTASVTTSPYKPALWVYNLREHTLTDGMIIIVKIPVATTAYSAFISIDNGATYKPIVVSNSTARLTTHYSVGDILVLFYDADGSCVTYAMTGATATSTITGGCWCVLSSYDSGNTNTLLRTYSSATNINVPLIGSSSANSTTAAWNTYTGTYKDWYGVIPNDDSKRAKINLSTGLVQIPGGITLGVSATAPTIDTDDYLIISDSSASGKLEKGPAFNTSNTTKWLTQAGTWTTPTAANVGALASETTVTNVSFASATDANAYPILMKHSTGSTTTAAGTKFNTSVTITPSTGLITATKFKQSGPSAWTIPVSTSGWAAATANSTYGITANDYTINITNSNNIPASTNGDYLLGLALNNTSEARAEAGSIGLRLYEITSSYLRFTATAIPTNTINVIIKALV